MFYPLEKEKESMRHLQIYATPFDDRYLPTCKVILITYVEQTTPQDIELQYLTHTQLETNVTA